MNRDSRYDDRGRYGGGESYRPPMNGPRSPRRDGYRGGRSPPRGPPSDRYNGPPSSKPIRRSRSPVGRGRDVSPRRPGFNEYKARDRTPPRRWSPRRDGPRREERPRSRSPFDRGQRQRPRSPLPTKRGRELSPDFRGRRSPPPKRERLSSPPGRGRFERLPTPEPRLVWQGRSPRTEERGRGDARRWNNRSPSSQAADRHIEERPDILSGRSSGANSRVPSPPIHPSRVPLRAGYDAQNRSPQNQQSGPLRRPARSPPRGPIASRPRSPPGRTGGWVGDRKPQSPRDNARARSPPSQHLTPDRPAYNDRDRQYPIRDRSPPPKRVDDYSRNNSSDTREQERFGQDSQQAPSYDSHGAPTSREVPTGPSRRFDSSNPPPAGPAISPHPPTGPSRPANSSILSAPREPRGGGRGMMPRRESHHSGPVPEYRRVPSGPRPSFGGPPAYRSNNSSSTTYPRTQRFSNHLADLPRVLPGGKINPAYEVSDKLKQLEADKRKLEDALVEKETRKRAALRDWNRYERDSMRETLKAELAEEQIRTISGENGYGGSAF